MQIVINFPDDSYNDIVNGTLPARCITEMLDAIKNGKPFPKGHGRLIYADDVDVNRIRDGEYFSIEDVIDDTPTIIEADEEDEVEECQMK